MRGPLHFCTLAVATLGLLLSSPAPGPPQEEVADSLDHDYSTELPRLRPLEPADALSSFEVHPAFRIELVAAEPLVHDPVAMAFDASGDLYVVEMRGYSEERDADLGAVRLLRDLDGDGTFDVSRVFLDGLRWPTAVACWDGGVFVAAAPDILYARDTDGDHVADLVETVFTGFHTTNVQGLLNTLKWGLDNRIHGATSLSGATVVPAHRPEGPPLTLRGRDFSFDPRTREIRAESGGGQHGLTFDRWGRKYVCHNSRQVIYVAYEDRDVARNPFLAPPAAGVDAAADGPSGDVFRISPVEPWRVVRTRLRVKGLVPGPIEGGGTASGYFTSATGITVYKGDAWPEEYRGNLIVGDVGSNLVHRKTVSWPGIIPVTTRARTGTEFVRSTDNWFRPVQFCNGPDGNLYVADMYREVIEHPDSLPPIIKRHLDLTSGRERGRIYRIAPKGHRRRVVPDLNRAGVATLIDLLGHPNAWHRETAARLLYERREPAPGLGGGSPEVPPIGRVSRLYALAGLGALGEEDVSRALVDPHPRVREHAARLASGLVSGNDDLARRVAALADDADPLVRYRVAFVMGDASAEASVPALVRLTRRDPANPWLRLAVLSSAARIAPGLLEALLEEGLDELADDVAVTWLEALARQVGAAGSRVDVVRSLALLEELPDGATSQAAVAGVIEGWRLARRGAIDELMAVSPRAARRILEGTLARARAVAVDKGADPAARTEALGALTLDRYERAAPVLGSVLDAREPPDVQRAAVRALGRFDDGAVPRLLVRKWPSLGPEVREDVLSALLASAARATVLLAAVESGPLAPSDLDSVRVQRLLNHPDPTVARRAEDLLGPRMKAPGADLTAVLEDLRSLVGDPARGREVFARSCAACHRLGGVGHSVGPDLKTVPRTAIPVGLLDPNREVSPQYVQYVVDTLDWGSYSGIISSETATSLTLRRAGGAEDTILKTNIESIRSTSLSLMPEGWGEALTRQELADLLTFVTTMAN